MLNLKEIASAIKGSILFHTKGITEMSKADEIFDQLRLLNESVLRQYLSLKNLKDTVDLRLKMIASLVAEIKTAMQTVTKVPKPLKLKALPEIIKAQDIELTQEELHEIFEYRDGELYWKITPGQRTKAGARAGCKRYNRVLKQFVYTIGYKSKRYRISRLIFKMFHGYIPEIVDFIDGDCLNTKIENLREINRSQSQYTRKLQMNNSSGYKGVSVKRNKWTATITQHKKSIYLGIFDNPEEAHKAYCRAAKKLHGEFANFG